jgi:dienelactone hydrolase
MPNRDVNEDDALEDFAAREITLDAAAKRVYVAGAGPAVIVMTEMPGISPHVARFARWVRDAGFTVWTPSLFGRDGAVALAEEGAAIFQRACCEFSPKRDPIRQIAQAIDLTRQSLDSLGPQFASAGTPMPCYFRV